MISFNPFFYLKKLRQKLFIYFYFNAESIKKEEEDKFISIGGNLDQALKKLNAILEIKRGKSFDFQSDSIHWLLWSVISLENSVKRVLEIGTFKGEGTSILAQLFPDAEIVTVDLPEDDPLLRAFYGRNTEEKYNEYREIQAKNIAFKNIKALKINSFFLPSVVTGSFDLVWVDGGHLFPDIAWDLSHAWNLTSPSGIIMCDDIIPEEKKYKNAYASSESYQVLQYLKERAPIKPILFLKRRNPELYASILKRKYVVYFRKVKG